MQMHQGIDQGNHHADHRGRTGGGNQGQDAELLRATYSPVLGTRKDLYFVCGDERHVYGRGLRDYSSNHHLEPLALRRSATRRADLREHVYL